MSDLIKLSAAELGRKLAASEMDDFSLEFLNISERNFT